MKFQTPRGTRDFLPQDMALRRAVINELVSVYKLFGFGEWDGPAFEYLETLTQKSGPAVVREIYNFQDKSGRELGLRFELTASIARIVADQSTNLKKPFKVYSIGKVWRYERPQIGRFREFLQADTDIFGSSSMACEVELLHVVATALENFGLENYRILLNNRKVLEAQLQIAGIEQEKKNEALRSLDKLSKIGEDGVLSEFIKAGIPEEKFNNLTRFIRVKGNNTERLETISDSLKGNTKGIEGVSELREILELLDKSGFKSPIEVDPTLVRGLDYYTGPIFEVRSMDVQAIGSFAGGGRYDKLISLFGGKETPAVGVSFGIERLIDVISRMKQKNPTSPIEVFVASISQEMLPLAMRTAQKFRKAGISAECDLLNRTLSKQLSYANTSNIRYVFTVFSEGEQKLKEMESGEERTLSVEEAIKKLSTS